MKTLDFLAKIKEYIKDSSEKNLKLQNSTINLINSNFNLPQILNLNQYYIDLENERKGPNYLILKDNLNLRIQSNFPTKITEIQPNLAATELETWLDKNEKYSKIKFYRESPYIYEYFKNEYKYILEAIAKQMEKDGMERESNILKFEIKQNKISEKWLELRRQKLKNER